MPNLKGQNIEELLINTSININFRIMNKSFLFVAGLAMISAVASAQITKTDGYTMLKSSSSDYLAVYGAKSDSVVVKTFSNLATVLKLLLTLLCGKVTEAGVDATGNKLYSFTNKKDWCCIVRCKKRC